MKRRTKQFALRVMKVVGTLPKTIVSPAIGSQLEVIGGSGLNIIMYYGLNSID